MTSAWRVAPAPQPLMDGEAHVWAVDREARDADQTLGPRERARVDALRFASDRARYAAGRGALRRILAAYLACEPAAVTFTIGPHGKPALDPLVHPNPLWFSNAASGPLALVAVTRASPIGVDLEAVVPFPELPELVAVHLAREERAELETTGPSGRLAAFYRCWTCKEAYLKAVGEGLTQPLHRFAVAIHAGAALLHVDGDRTEGGEWSLIHLDPRPAFVGALACRARGLRVAMFNADAPGQDALVTPI